MDPRLLRYFLAVVDTGSLSRAAGVVHVAEPSLSRQVRRLEAHLGMALFTRERGRLVLTPAGHRLVPIATDLVARLDHALATMRSLASPTSLALSVTAHATTIRDVVAPFVAQSSMGMALDMSEAHTDLHYAAVAGGAADLAITAAPGAGRLASRLVARFPLFAQVPAGHRWSRRRHVELAELLGQPLVVLDGRSASRRLLDHAVGLQALTYDLAFEVGLSDAAQALAASGRGVAVLTDEPRYGLVALPIRDHGRVLCLPIVALWRTDHYAADRILVLADELAAWCGSMFPSVGSPRQAVGPPQQAVARVGGSVPAPTADPCRRGPETRGAGGLLDDPCDGEEGQVPIWSAGELHTHG